MKEAIDIKGTLLDSKGIFLPSKWLQKEKYINWEDVEAIDFYKGQLILKYKSKSGKIKKVHVGESNKYRSHILEFWKNDLIREFNQKGELTGTIISKLSEINLKTNIVLSFLAILFFIGYLGIWTPYSGFSKMSKLPEIITVFKWATYQLWIIISIFLSMSISLIKMSIDNLKCIKQWKSWKVNRKGFYTENVNGEWDCLSVSPDDEFYWRSASIGGKTIPLISNQFGMLTKSLILPHILAIHAKNGYKLPKIIDSPFPLSMAFRFLVFWPFVCLGILYLPSIIWEVPPELYVRIVIAFKVSIIAFSISALLSFFAHKFIPSNKEEILSFPDEVKEIKKKLKL